jgi:hypothetical protein
MAQRAQCHKSVMVFGSKPCKTKPVSEIGAFQVRIVRLASHIRQSSRFCISPHDVCLIGGGPIVPVQ